MIIKRFITLVMALSLAFSISTAMAGKSDKSDKSDKSAKYSQKSDKSDKSRKGKGKKGKKGKNSNKSDKSDKSGKSDKSDKSGKSDKSDKEPPACFSSFEDSYIAPNPNDEEASEYIGTITGEICTAAELDTVLNDEYFPPGSSNTFCEVTSAPDFAEVGPYDVNLELTCTTDTNPPGGPIGPV